MKTLNIVILFSVLFGCFTENKAQFDDTHTNWSVSTKKINATEYDVLIKAQIEKDWHIYAVYLERNDGPTPTTIEFTGKDEGKYELVGALKESKPESHFDDLFGFNIAYHKKEALFTQRVKLLAEEVNIDVDYKFLVCMSDGQCIPGMFNPPIPITLKADVKKEVVVDEPEELPALDKLVPLAQKKAKEHLEEEVADKKEAPEDLLSTIQIKPLDTTVVEGSSAEAEAVVKDELLEADDDTSIVGKDWWQIFSLGFGLGFIALLTPCVFPLIPMNVSFFLKRSESKGKGRTDALIFVFSIIAIFITLGLLVTMLVDERALHAFSTSAVFNSVIFILLLIFAASFLGAFEITLPAGLVNKIDAQSDRGGYIGIFFMALTLVVVSFSCTGPIVATALSAAAGLGNVSGAFWILFGFSSGLALPFGFFAFFPSLLGNIPQSGGWLNTVKVVLGFLELALALKFASNVDLVYQAGILTREVFLVLWVAIFGLITIYLLGGFKTSHDSDVKYLSVARLFMIVLSFAFTVYLIPGLWGAPLKLLSGVLPPYEYSESPHGFGASSKAFKDNLEDGGFEVNKNGIKHFKNNYQEALAYANKVNKPLMIDFTGHACANCRKVEDNVWPNAEVKRRLNNDVVLVSLYVDDKRALPESEVQTVQWNGRDFEITTIGEKNIYMQKIRYDKIAQPWYVLVDKNERLLTSPRGYTSSVEDYVAWLDKGVKAFHGK